MTPAQYYLYQHSISSDTSKSLKEYIFCHVFCNAWLSRILPDYYSWHDSNVHLFTMMQVYLDSPGNCVWWFNNQLGYRYYPEQDGTAAEWMISLVSIRFQETSHSKRYGASTENFTSHCVFIFCTSAAGCTQLQYVNCMDAS